MNNWLMRCQRWSENPAVLWAIFSLTLAASWYRGYGFSNNSYAIASWLVTYEGGFIKRGLIGSILQLEVLSKIFQVSVPILFFWITNTLLVVLHVLVLVVAMRMVRLNKIALLFIPYFLAGPLLRTQSVWIGNIDHLLAIMMLAITWSLVREKYYLAILVSVTGIFIHEIIFAMVFPLFSFWLLEKLVSRNSIKSRGFYLMAAGLLINVLVLLVVILYHDRVFSTQHASTYIGDMLLRQAEDHYNSGVIIEAYTTSFWDWFLFQKGDFGKRISDPLLFFVVVIPAFVFLRICGGKSKKDNYIFIAAFLFACMPLTVLLIAWDIDRIWNLSIWVLFLMIWLQLETKKPTLVFSRTTVLVVLLVSAPAFLMPQARSNIAWDVLWVIYLPLILWLLVFIVGNFYKNAK